MIDIGKQLQDAFNDGYKQGKQDEWIPLNLKGVLLMSRILKFRAWDKVEKEMVEHEDLLIKVKAINEFNNYYHFMQYTGLKDKNGKDIYEGDICIYISKDKTLNRKGIIKFEHGYFGLTFNDGRLGALANILDDNIDVIGNIYENPELLEGVE